MSVVGDDRQYGCSGRGPHRRGCVVSTIPDYERHECAYDYHPQDSNVMYCVVCKRLRMAKSVMAEMDGLPDPDDLPGDYGPAFPEPEPRCDPDEHFRRECWHFAGAS